MEGLDKMILSTLPDICKTVLDVEKKAGGGVGREDRKETKVHGMPEHSNPKQ